MAQALPRCLLLSLVVRSSSFLNPAPRHATLRLRAAVDKRRSDEEWRATLSEDAYYVLREEGTEPPRSSPLNDVTDPGTFLCKACGEPLFTTATKFDSGTGWPSFFDPPTATPWSCADFKLVLPRTEVRCAACDGHLGHVFDDGPRPTGCRYCLNGVALNFVADADDADLAAAVVAREAAAAPVAKPLSTTLPSLAFNVALAGAFFAPFAARSDTAPADAGAVGAARGDVLAERSLAEPGGEEVGHDEAAQRRGAGVVK
ncbi:peptide-methionine (R)-S-oxide reductase [Aureococcus anophagefferens]|nr:peptide-methionine (R)-S-oxide reductase [Aureococcus anophagefferens]